MKAKYIYKPKRQKAFLGAIIGAVSGIASSIIGANQQKKANEAALKEQQKQYNIDQINSLIQASQDRAYIDAYKDRISFKCGGRKKALLGANTNNNTYYDRRNMYKIGGRKRGKC